MLYKTKATDEQSQLQRKKERMRNVSNEIRFEKAGHCIIVNNVKTFLDNFNLSSIILIIIFLANSYFCSQSTGRGAQNF